MAFAEILAALGPMIASVFGGKGSKDQMKQVSNISPEQSQFLNQMLAQLSPSGSLGQGNQQANNYYQDMLNPSQGSFDKFADPFRREFDQQTVPGLAERFAGYGGGMGGGLSSSGFGQSLSAAGGNLQSTLAQLKAGLGMQAAQGLSNQYGNQSSLALGTKPFGYSYQPGGPSSFQSFMNSYASSGFPGISGLASGGQQTPSSPVASQGIGGGSGVSYTKPMGVGMTNFNGRRPGVS